MWQDEGRTQSRGNTVRVEKKKKYRTVAVQIVTIEHPDVAIQVT